MWYFWFFREKQFYGQSILVAPIAEKTFHKYVPNKGTTYQDISSHLAPIA